MARGTFLWFCQDFLRPVNARSNDFPRKTVNIPIDKSNRLGYKKEMKTESLIDAPFLFRPCDGHLEVLRL